MAGSHGHAIRCGGSDPVLSARLEALQLLAERMCSRVMVVDRDLTIIYANEGGWTGGQEHFRPLQPAKCYEAFLNRSDPCTLCPAKEAFRSGEVRTISCRVGGDGTTCGMQQAYPLLSSNGTVGSVVVLFGGGACRPADRDDEGSGAPPWGDDVSELVGQSRVIRELTAMVRLVANGQATVLIQGETGTGKELVARIIHRLSPRRDRPFIVVDCSALSETLLESELFGHVKGAFTGAVSSKKGLFQEADGGIIFLDEVAETSSQFQAKLLRVVQEGEVRAVGSTRTVRVDVRVLSASNKDLSQLVKARAFREDLYYRLAVLPLFLPPLRERREDIPDLTHHFLRLACERHRRPIPILSEEAMSALSHAPWPGNVRQLQHLIERIVVTARNAELTAEDFFGRTTEVAVSEDLRSVATEAKQRAEHVRILSALRVTGGNRSKAAHVLKISRASLYNKLREYRIQ